MSPCRVPVATYRLQFTPDFGFADAVPLMPYLHALGITDLYASPFFRAQRGSLHGYDVTDHSIINPELGTEGDLEALALAQHGMGLLMDVVPNHMGISDVSNRWWQDVIENGRNSPYAHFFDIDWGPRSGDRPLGLHAPPRTIGASPLIKVETKERPPHP